MELQNLSLSEARELIKNPKSNTLIVWHALWSGPAVCFMKNLKQMPDIPDIIVYEIDIDNPEIDTKELEKLNIHSVPVTFFINKKFPGTFHTKSGVISYQKLLDWVKA